jgi:fructose/tagatose bisphosphate aldolase
MALVPFAGLMQAAQRGKYAVGYFEAWNLESLLAVADAAESFGSPVLLGFSGIYLPHPDRRTREHLQDYFSLAQSVAARLNVPACLVFNESPHRGWVEQAIELGFGLVMHTPSAVVPPESPSSALQPLIRLAHQHGVAVEAELEPLVGVGGQVTAPPPQPALTDPARAREFVGETGIDALAVNVGQVHLHGRVVVRLDLERLRAVRDAVNVPLVLHGATSVHPDDVRAAIQIGVQKINVGSALKRVYFETLRAACAKIGNAYNPYEVIGSGLDADVLTTARLAMQRNVEAWIQLFGAQGRAS